MKKISALLLLAATLITVFVGCNKNDASDAESTAADTTVSDTTEAEPVIAAGFTLSPEEDGIMFADQSKRNRSSHLGHALVEYAPGKILAFYSNTSGEIRDGHNCVGWVEYKRSEDGGQTWSDPVVLEYSKQQFDRQESLIACEKAVLTADGKIVLFCYSSDNGVTWSAARDLGTKMGRPLDVVVKDGDIYVLIKIADHDLKAGEPTYVMYKSENNGKTFYKSGNVTKKTGLFYGNMVLTPEGKIYVYIYRFVDERNLLRFETEDGKTINEAGTVYCAKKIRNPQVIYFKGWYFLHGRSGNDGPYFVLYSSRDGINWDEGTYIKRVSAGFDGSCYYSNNLIVNGERILIQASDNYSGARTNVKHWWIDFTE